MSKIDDLNLVRAPADALGALQEIHTWMGRVSCYRNLSGPAAIAAGAATFVGALALWLHSGSAPEPRPFCITWGSVLAFSALTNLALTGRKALQRGEPVLSRLGSTVICALLPGLAAGGVLTLVLGMRDLWDIIPGSWMLLYGCAILSARFFCPKGAGVFGLVFLIMGALTLLTNTGTGQNPWLMALSFGLMHVAFGVHLIVQERVAGTGEVRS